MTISQKQFMSLTAETLTASVVVDVFTTLDKAYGRTTQVCKMMLALIESDRPAAESLIVASAAGFGVGGENTPAYRRHASFKTIFAREASKRERPINVRWMRTADAVISGLEITEKPKQAEPVNTNVDVGTTSNTPQHVEEEKQPVKFKSVSDITAAVMAGKPARTKISTVIISLIAKLGRAGIAEVLTACEARTAELDKQDAEEFANKAA